MVALNGIEKLAAEAYLYTVLTGTDTAEIAAAGPGGVWRYEVPTEVNGTPVALPAWVFQNQDNGGIDTQAMGSTPVMVTMRYAVKLVIPGMSVSSAQRAGLMKMFELLNGKSGIAYGLRVDSHREGPLSYPEDDQQRRYLHEGGVFILQVTGA
jgi:hypothetical protein